MTTIKFDHLQNSHRAVDAPAPQAVPGAVPGAVEGQAAGQGGDRRRGPDNPAIVKSVPRRARMLASEMDIGSDQEKLREIAEKAGVDCEGLPARWVGDNVGDPRVEGIKNALKALMLSDEMARRFRKVDSVPLSEQEIETLKTAALELAARVESGAVAKEFLTVAANNGKEVDLNDPEAMLEIAEKAADRMRKTTFDHAWRDSYEMFAAKLNDDAAAYLNNADVKELINGLKAKYPDIAARRLVEFIKVGKPSRVGRDWFETIPGVVGKIRLGICGVDEMVDKFIIEAKSLLGDEAKNLKAETKDALKKLVELSYAKARLYYAGKAVSARCDEITEKFKEPTDRMLPASVEAELLAVIKTTLSDTDMDYDGFEKQFTDKTVSSGQLILALGHLEERRKVFPLGICLKRNDADALLRFIADGNGNGELSHRAVGDWFKALRRTLANGERQVEPGSWQDRILVAAERMAHTALAGRQTAPPPDLFKKIDDVQTDGKDALQKKDALKAFLQSERVAVLLKLADPGFYAGGTDMSKIHDATSGRARRILRHVLSAFPDITEMYKTPEARAAAAAKAVRELCDQADRIFQNIAGEDLALAGVTSELKNRLAFLSNAVDYGSLEGNDVPERMEKLRGNLQDAKEKLGSGKAVKDAVADFRNTLLSMSELFTEAEDEFEIINFPRFYGGDVLENLKSDIDRLSDHLRASAAASLKRKICNAQKEAMKRMDEHSGNTSLTFTVDVSAEIASLAGLEGYARFGGQLTITALAAIQAAHGPVTAMRDISFSLTGGGGIKTGLKVGKSLVAVCGDDVSKSDADIFSGTLTVTGGFGVTTIYPDLDTYVNECGNTLMKALLSRCYSIRSTGTKDVRLAGIDNMRFNDRLHELGVLGRFDDVRLAEVNQRVFTRVHKSKVDGAGTLSGGLGPIVNGSATGGATFTMIDTRNYVPIATEFRKQVASGKSLDDVFGKEVKHLKSRCDLGNDMPQDLNLPYLKYLEKCCSGNEGAWMDNVRETLARHIRSLHEELEEFARAAADNDLGKTGNPREAELRNNRGHHTRTGYMHEVALVYAALAGLYDRACARLDAAAGDRERAGMSARLEYLEGFLTNPPIWVSVTKANSRFRSWFSTGRGFRHSLYVPKSKKAKELSLRLSGKVSALPIANAGATGITSRPITVTANGKFTAPVSKCDTHYRPNEVTSISLDCQIPHGVVLEVAEQIIEKTLLEKGDALKKVGGVAEGVITPLVKEAVSNLATWGICTGLKEVPLPKTMALNGLVKRGNAIGLVVNFYKGPGGWHFGNFQVNETESTTTSLSFMPKVMFPGVSDVGVKITGAMARRTSVCLVEVMTPSSLTPYMIKLAAMGSTRCQAWGTFVARNEKMCVKLLKNIKKATGEHPPDENKTLRNEINHYRDRANDLIPPGGHPAKQALDAALGAIANLDDNDYENADTVTARLGGLLAAMMMVDAAVKEAQTVVNAPAAPQAGANHNQTETQQVESDAEEVEYEMKEAEYETEEAEYETEKDGE